LPPAPVFRPISATFRVTPAEPSPGACNARNPGVQMLPFTVKTPPDGSLDLEAGLTLTKFHP